MTTTPAGHITVGGQHYRYPGALPWPVRRARRVLTSIFQETVMPTAPALTDSTDIDWGEGADEPIAPMAEACDLENPEACETCQ